MSRKFQFCVHNVLTDECFPRNIGRDHLRQNVKLRSNHKRSKIQCKSQVCSWNCANRLIEMYLLFCRDISSPSSYFVQSVALAHKVKTRCFMCWISIRFIAKRSPFKIETSTLTRFHTHTHTNAMYPKILTI